MARTEARQHPDMPDTSPLQWGAEVVVTTRDGQRLASRLDDFERRGPGGAPMSTEELWAKFEDCAKRALPRPQIAPLFDLLGRIETVGSVSELGDAAGTARACGPRRAVKPHIGRSTHER